MNSALRSRFKRIKMLVTDVDGVLTDAGMYYSENGDEMKKFNTRDGMGLSLLRKAGYKIAIATSENTKIVERRAAKLKITDLFQGVRKKAEAIETLRQHYSLSWNEIAFIGDDVNDLDIMKRVGLAITPANGSEHNKKIAHYITKAKGGEGCVREVCEVLLAFHGGVEKVWNS